ncbi:MAG: hypothetical protein FJ004_09915 [Chloroflexi bacterium]|nr:hypothetical protein [Chloroflexota bacterium]
MFNARLNKLTTAFVLISLLSCIALIGCAGPRGWPGTYAEDDVLYAGSSDGRVLALNPDSGSRKWEWSPSVTQSAGFGACLGGGSGLVSGMSYETPTVWEGTVYIAAYTGRVYAIDAASGVEKWSYDAESAIAGGVAIGNDMVFVGSSNGKLSALDAQGGSLKWTFASHNRIWTTPVVADGTVYFGSLDHYIYALNASDGTEKWKYETGGSVASTPLIVDGIVYVGSFDNKFYAIDANEGTVLWVFEGAGNWYWAEAIYGNGTIYTCALDSKVYALDSGNGALLWSFETDSLIKSSPVISGGLLVVASELGKVYGLDLTTGQGKWKFEGIESKVLAPLAAAGDKVYINAQNNKLFSLDGATGRQIWSVSLSK